MPTKNSKSIYSVNGPTRNQTARVMVGNIPMGDQQPVRVQTMTNTNTNSIELSIEQIERVIAAGAEMVRLTTQGLKEVDSLATIKKTLREAGVEIPIIADIHFSSKVAMAASAIADKIRINPGNYSGVSRSSDEILTESEYQEELSKAEMLFSELIYSCKLNNTAMRIGVNHGSLAKRIMDKYGDTPKGMAISAMEFIRMCQKFDFHKVVVSMKSSNTRIMVHATRMLAQMMQQEGLNYPIHLGVTEAGEGEDGRIKSAVGIGTLLLDGIGDTIRVSLTEEPENEIPVAKTLAQLFQGWQPKLGFVPSKINVNPFEYSRRETHEQHGIGGHKPPAVVAYVEKLTEESLKELGWEFIQNQWVAHSGSPDFILVDSWNHDDIQLYNQLPIISSSPVGMFEIVKLQGEEQDISIASNQLLWIDAETFNLNIQRVIEQNEHAPIILHGNSQHSIYAIRNVLFQLHALGLKNPCIISNHINAQNVTDFQITAASTLGSLFIDGLADGLLLSADHIPQKTIIQTSFDILQAARVRMSKTEFISCPGCGRTLFGLNSTLQKVKQRLSHLKGLKIAVMGCIVNGPGEMADADYGYVGAGPGRVTLYCRKEVVKKNIPEEDAVEELVAIIKANGDWIEEQ